MFIFGPGANTVMHLEKAQCVFERSTHEQPRNGLHAHFCAASCGQPFVWTNDPPERIHRDCENQSRPSRLVKRALSLVGITPERWTKIAQAMRRARRINDVGDCGCAKRGEKLDRWWFTH